MTHSLMPMFARRTGYVSLFQILTDASLTTNLKVCLDAGDSASYSSGQSWLDRSGGGYDFFLGADGSATATDPTFNGSAGGRSASEYFSYDGGDYNRYDTTNEAWMQTLHKDAAVFSLVIMVYGTVAGRIWGTTGNALGAGVELGVLSAAAPRLVGYNASGVTIDKTATTIPGAGVWNMIGLSVNENGGNVSFHYLNGAYNQVSASNTFDASYASPATGNANFTMEIGACGNGQTPVASGTRIATVAIWQGTALSKANFDTIWAAHKTRFGL